MALRPVGNGDFSVVLPDLGAFVFGRRQQRDTYLIRGEYNRLTGGGNYADDGRINDWLAFAHATILVLMVGCPDSFSLDKLDPLLDDECDAKIMKIFSALREKELSFRPTQAVGEASKTGSA